VSGFKRMMSASATCARTVIASSLASCRIIGVVWLAFRVCPKRALRLTTVPSIGAVAAECGLHLFDLRLDGSGGGAGFFIVEFAVLVILFADALAVQQRAVTLEQLAGEYHVGLLSSQLGLQILDIGFVGLHPGRINPRIDFGQQLPGLDLIADVDVQLL